MRIKYSKILMWLLIISPIVDNINGYMRLATGRTSNISVVYKTIIFLFCIFVLTKLVISRRKIIYSACMLIFLAIQISIFEMNNAGGISYNVATLIRLFMPLIIVLSMKELKRFDISVINCVDKISTFFCWFFPLSLIIPMIFNIGFHTYDYKWGNKGFYYAGNEISVIMIIVLILEIERYKANKNRLNLFSIILGVAGTICIGTKSTYIALAVLIVIALYSEETINKKMLNIFLVIPLVFGGLWYVINNINIISQNIEIILWKYSRSSSMVNFLLSGREVAMKRAYELVYNNSFWRKFIFGIGSYAAERGEQLISIEMDLFDLIIRFGVVVSIIIIKFYGEYIKKVITLKRIVYIVGVALLYGVSLISGHVIFAPMVGVTFAVLLLKIEFEADILG